FVLLFRRCRLFEGFRRHRRALRRLRPRRAADRRLRTSLVHEDHAHEPGRGAQGRARAPVARDSLGHVRRADRRKPLRAAAAARRGAAQGGSERGAVLRPEARRNPLSRAQMKSGKPWLRRHVTDPYVRQAKAQGYRSRSAFKLLQIDAKEKILKPGQLVVDLGAAPGGWSQVAAAKVKPSGRVIAIDLLPIAPISAVTLLKGDFRGAALL